MNSNNKLKIIDTHAHLDFPDLYPRIQSVINDAHVNDVCKIITISTNLSKIDKLIQISEDNSELITEDIDSETYSESTNNTNNSWKNFFFNMFSFNYNPVNYINNFFLFTRGILRFFNFWS